MKWQIPDEVMLVIYLACTTVGEALAVLGTALLVCVIVGSFLLAWLAETLFDTSILDDEPHEQKTAHPEQEYGFGTHP